MGRRNAVLVEKDGSSRKIPRKLAYQLVDSGSHKILRERPLTVAVDDCPNYHEEQRHLSGRIVPRATRVGLGGKVIRARGVRVRVARSQYDREMVRMEKELRRKRKELADAAVGEGDATGGGSEG